jgi:hypothetical protein
MPPLADRLLEAFTEPATLRIVRALAEADQTQASLVGSLGMGQSVASRTLKTLRLLGVVDAESPRSAIRLRAPDEVRAVLLATDRLAEALLKEDATDQRELSDRTRRAAVRRAPSERAAVKGPRTS